jgi:hypothetical protein
MKKQKPTLGQAVTEPKAAPVPQSQPIVQPQISQADRVAQCRREMQAVLDRYDCSIVAHMSSEPFNSRMLVTAHVTVIPNDVDLAR